MWDKREGEKKRLVFYLFDMMEEEKEEEDRRRTEGSKKGGCDSKYIIILLLLLLSYYWDFVCSHVKFWTWETHHHPMKNGKMRNIERLENGKPKPRIPRKKMKREKELVRGTYMLIQN